MFRASSSHPDGKMIAVRCITGGGGPLAFLQHGNINYVCMPCRPPSGQHVT